MWKRTLVLAVFAATAMVIAQARAQETKTEQPATVVASHHATIFREVRVEKGKNFTVEQAVSRLAQAALTSGMLVVGYVNEGAEASAGAAKPIEARFTGGELSRCEQVADRGSSGCISRTHADHSVRT
jgi:hypothetical protein